MGIDPSQFHPLNVADTCALWNLLSSRRMYSAARDANCSFCCTTFVAYECLHKRRASEVSEEDVLKTRLKREIESARIVSYSLDVADLQDVTVLESRRKLSKGELSSIAFANKTRQAFLTDDQKARKLAESFLTSKMTQTTPHLFGWLIFTWRLSDADKDHVIEEHEQFIRPLRPYFEEMYLEALRCRSLAQMASGNEPRKLSTTDFQ
jgi:hypothetical protein